MDRVIAPSIPNIRTLGDLFAMIINIILGIGWAMMFVMLALGLVNYIMSKGEPKAVQGARNWLISAVLGGIGLFFITTFESILLKLIGLDPSKALIGDPSINPLLSR